VGFTMCADMHNLHSRYLQAQLAELKALRQGDSETPHYFVHYNGWSKK